MHGELTALKFLEEVEKDLDSGGLRPLETYLEEFPEHPDLVKEEFAKLVDTVDAAAPVLPDTLLGNRYRLLASLGRGGFGEVFLADDTTLNRRVAVKVLSGLRALNYEWRQRLIREAEITGRLADDGVCPIHDVGFEDAVPFLVMPWIDGRPLDRLLADAAAEGEGPVPLASPEGPEQRRNAVLRMIEQVARTLHTAHLAGVVHRDVKPGNILIRPQGTPVLIDFGLAWLEDADAPRSRSGHLGTPAYAAPELVHGSSRPTPAADLWSLGAVLFESLTLRRLITAPAGLPASDLLLVDWIPELPQEFGPELRAVLEHALVGNPLQRYRDAAAFADDLNRLLRGEPVSVRPAGAVRRLRIWLRRHATGLAVATVAATVLIAATTAALLAWSHFQERTAVTRTADAMAAHMDQLVRDSQQLARYGFVIDERAEQASQLLGHLQELRAGIGPSPEVDRSLARMLDALAGLEMHRHNFLRGRELARQAVRILEPFATGAFASKADRQALAHAVILLGDSHAGRKEHHEALRNFRRAFDLDAGLLAEEPDDPTRLSNLGFGHLRIAIRLKILSRTDEMLAELERARSLLLAAEAAAPEAVERRGHTVDALIELATALDDLGRDPERVDALCAECMRRTDEMCRTFPLDAWSWHRRMAFLTRLTRFRTEHRDPLTNAREAVAAARRVVQIEPRLAESHRILCSALWCLSERETAANLDEAALRSAEGALAAILKAIESTEGSLSLKLDHAVALAIVGRGALGMGQTSRAESQLVTALGICTEVLDDPDLEASIRERTYRILTYPEFARVGGHRFAHDRLSASLAAAGSLSEPLAKLLAYFQALLR